MIYADSDSSVMSPVFEMCFAAGVAVVESPVPSLAFDELGCSGTFVLKASFLQLGFLAERIVFVVVAAAVVVVEYAAVIGLCTR